jgi:hypothetical protein
METTTRWVKRFKRKAGDVASALQGCLLRSFEAVIRLTSQAEEIYCRLMSLVGRLKKIEAIVQRVNIRFHLPWLDRQ